MILKPTEGQLAELILYALSNRKIAINSSLLGYFQNLLNENAEARSEFEKAIELAESNHQSDVDGHLTDRRLPSWRMYAQPERFSKFFWSASITGLTIYDRGVLEDAAESAFIKLAKDAGVSTDPSDFKIAATLYVSSLLNELYEIAQPWLPSNQFAEGENEDPNSGDIAIESNRNQSTAFDLSQLFTDDMTRLYEEAIKPIVAEIIDVPEELIRKTLENNEFAIGKVTELGRQPFLEFQESLNTFNEQQRHQVAQWANLQLPALMNLAATLANFPANAANSSESEDTKGTSDIGEEEKFLEQVRLDSDGAAKTDRLGRQGLAIAFRNWFSRHWLAFQGQPDSKSYILHLYGEWGSGKSTILNLLEGKLRPQNGRAPSDWRKLLKVDASHAQGELSWIVVRFNAWQHQHIDPAWWPLYDQIYRQATEKLATQFPKDLTAASIRTQETRWRGSAIDTPEYLWAAGISFIVLVISIWVFGTSGVTLGARLGSIGDLLELLITLGSGLGVFFAGSRFLARRLLKTPDVANAFMQVGEDSLEKVRLHFEDLMAEIDTPVIVFVDDLDRCRKEYTVALLESIVNLFNSRRVFYIVAADRLWLYICFEEMYKDFQKDHNQPGRRLGYFFLQKIFQLSLKVPPLEATAVSQYLKYLSRGEERAFENELLQSRAEVKAAFEDVGTDEALQAVLQPILQDQNVPAIQKMVFRDVAVEQLSSPEFEEQDEVFLARFVDKLEHNPRALKRFAQAFAAFRAVAIYADAYSFQENAKEQFALWVILSMRWPQLAEYLEGNPDRIEDFLNEEKDADIPSDLAPLLTSMDVLGVVKGLSEGAQLNAEVVRKFSGLAGF